MKELMIYIGRFNPFHNGHAEIISRALCRSKKLLILIGSSGLSRSIKNPFTFLERKQMIEEWLETNHSDAEVYILPIYDYPYNDSKWIAHVQETIDDFSITIGLNSPKRVLVGSNKDSSTWYLQAFGGYFELDLVEPSKINGIAINATEIRNAYLGGEASLSNLPASTLKFLNQFKTDKTKEFDNLSQEWKTVKLYKASWSKAPYPPIFTTVDAIVIQSGYILVVTREASPGKGLWALPGGFVEQNEKLEDACIRELEEETNIGLSKAQLRGSIIKKEIFDLPDRSSRGRTITIAYYLKLNDTSPLPKVKGRAGETSNVSWIPISVALKNRNRWFEDHHAIIQEML